MTGDLHWWLDLAPTLRWWLGHDDARVSAQLHRAGQAVGNADFERAVETIRRFGEPGMFFDKTRVYLTHGDSEMVDYGLGPGRHDDHQPGVGSCSSAISRRPRVRAGQSAHRRPVSGSSPALRRSLRHPGVRCGEFGGVARGHTRPLDRPPPTSPACSISGAAQAWRLTCICLRTTGAICTSESTRAKPCSTSWSASIPWVRSLQPQTAEEFVADERAGTRTFDTVLALFGSASYFQPETIRRLPALADRLLVLMNYLPGYLPDYYDGDLLVSRAAIRSWEAAVTLPNAVTTRLNNFAVTTVFRP